MKRVLLLFAAGAVASGASAQLATSSAVRMDAKHQTIEGHVAQPVQNNVNLKQVQANRPQTAAAAKTTATYNGSRWYNYVDLREKLNVDIANNQSFPYLWDKPNMLAIYSDGAGGVVADTITHSSYGMVLHPFYSGFNDQFAWGAQEFGITSTTPYALDSVSVYGIYGRNSTKTAVVDTLVLGFVYGGAQSGSNLPIYYFTGMTQDFGVDTLRFPGMYHDSVANTAGRWPLTNPAVVIRRIPMTNASLTDALVPGGNGLHRFSTAVNMNVPAGNLVGVSVTFKSGEPWTMMDTVFRGSVNPNEPFKYNMFRPMYFEDHDNDFADYTPGNYNTGQTKFSVGNPGWAGMYIPHWAFTGPFSQEYPYIDFKLSSTSMIKLDVQKFDNIIGSAQAVPNPANNEVSIPVSLKQNASITVSLMNTVGQVVKSQNLGAVAAGQVATARFQTADLAAGVYLYVVEANGQRMTGRVVVAH